MTKKYCEEILKKSCVLTWNGEKCNWSDFRSSKMAVDNHFIHKFQNEKACARHYLIKNATINFIFDVAIELL